MISRLYAKFLICMRFSPTSLCPLRCSLDVQGFSNGSAVNESACSAGNAGDTGFNLGWQDPLEKEMATHSSILAWRIPWTGEPGRLQSIEWQRLDMSEVA